MAKKNGVNRQALEGVKIADFSWAVTGPLSTKLMGDYGATVVRVESSRKPDILRTGAPFAGDTPGIERSGTFAEYNANKYSICLNLGNPEGLAVAKKLVAWSDVVIENFSPGIMEKWGLTYNDLKKIKPDVIMLRASMQGQTGPHAAQVGYGIMLQALTGITAVVGWPDREPVGTAVPYTDFISPFYVMVALIGCLDYRRRTGKGQYIDLSQFESGISFLSPAVLDYSANKRVAKCIGNSHPQAAPHAAYRCQGDDRWCAIAIFTDEAWKSFCKILSNCDWVNKPEFATLASRKAHEDELNSLIEQWTINRTAEEIMDQMQAAGVPCGVVQDPRDLHNDPQLKHRHYFWELEHPEVGKTTYYGPTFLLSKTPANLKMPAPCLGQHTEYVCTKILGMSDQEFIEKMQAGALE